MHIRLPSNEKKRFPVQTLSGERLAENRSWRDNAIQRQLLNLSAVCIEVCSNPTTSPDSMVMRVSQCTVKQILETATLLFSRSEPEQLQSLVSTGPALNHPACLPDLLLSPTIEPGSSAVPRNEIPKDNDASHLTALSRRRSLFLVVGYLIDRLRLEAAKGKSSNTTLILLLDSLLAVLSVLPAGIVRYQQFTDLIWRDLCPSLVSMMQSNSLGYQPLQPFDGSFEVGRGSGAESLTSPFPSTVLVMCYKICVRLTELFGPILDMRSMLESLFHAMLLYPPPKQRLEAFRSIQTMLSSTQAIMLITLPCWTVVSSGSLEEPLNTFHMVSHWSSDSYHSPITPPFRLLKIIVDSLCQSLASGDLGSVFQATVDCLSNLVRSLDCMSRGEGSELWSNHPLVSTQANLAICQRGKFEAFTQGSRGPNHLVQSTSRIVSHITSDILQLPSEIIVGETGDINENPQPRCSTPTTPTEQDHQLAQEYIAALERLIPSLLLIGNLTELDQVIQGFSSGFCAQLVSKRHDSTSLFPTHPCARDVQNPVMNADAIYVTTYATLSLNLRLLLCDFYKKPSELMSLEVSQESFVNSVLEHKLLVFLPAGFLVRVFQMVTAHNYLGSAGFNFSATSSESNYFRSLAEQHFQAPGHALYSLLASSVVFREGRTRTCSEHRPISTPPSVSRTVASCICCVIWQPLLDGFRGMLSLPGLFDSSNSPLTSHSLSETGSFVGKIERFTVNAEVLLMNRLPQSIRDSLDSLEIAQHQILSCLFEALRLVYRLGLRGECHRMLEELVSFLTQSSERTFLNVETTFADSNPAGSIGRQDISVHYIQIHLLHQLLSMCNEVDMICDQIFWISIFRACRLICWLEHCNFVRSNAQRGGDLVGYPEYSDGGDLNPLDAVHNWLRETQLKHASTMGFSPSKERAVLGSAGILDSDNVDRVLWLLSRAVEQLVDRAVLDFPLEKLLCFAAALIATLTKSDKYLDSCLNCALSFDPLVDRLCQLLVSSVYNSQRPLVHLIYLWALVADPLMSVCYVQSKSCVAGPEGQRLLHQRVLACLHNCIATQITIYPEFPHFNVNEALLKPFETSLNLERCDGEIQDRIVSCLCELIEASGEYLRSAWRPLFRALRSVQLNFLSPLRIVPADRFASARSHLSTIRQLLHRLRGPAGSMKTVPCNGSIVAKETEHEVASCAKHIGTVMEVFEVFLATTNIQVFCDAAVDCVLCLLHYVKVGSTQSVVDCGGDSFTESDLNTFEIFVRMTDDGPCSSATCLTGGQGDLLCSLFEPVAVSNQPETEKLGGPNTMFISAVNSLIRCVCWLERLWTVHEVPCIRDALQQTKLHCGRFATTSDTSCVSDSVLQTDITDLAALDNGSGILHLYFLIVRQLTQLLGHCTAPIQRRILMDHVIKLIHAAPLIFAEDAQSTSPSAGSVFAVLMASRILIPGLKECICRYLAVHSTSDFRVVSFKVKTNGIYLCSDDSPQVQLSPSHSSFDSPLIGSASSPAFEDLRFIRLFLGQAAELVMDFVRQFATDPLVADHVPQLFDGWLQLLHVAVESVQCPLSHLGAACMGHTLLHHGFCLPPSYWLSAIEHLHKALESTFYPVEHLICENPSIDTYSLIRVEYLCPQDTNRTKHIRLLGRKLFFRTPDTSSSMSCDHRTDEEVDSSALSFDKRLTPQFQDIDETTHTLVIRPKLEDIVRGLISHGILSQVVILLLIPKSLPTHLFMPLKGPFPLQSEMGHVGMPESHPISLEKLYTLFIPCLVRKFNVCMQITRCCWLRTTVQKMCELPADCSLSSQAADSLSLLLRILVQLFFRHNSRDSRCNVPIPSSPFTSNANALVLAEFNATSSVLADSLSRILYFLMKLYQPYDSSVDDPKRLILDTTVLMESPKDPVGLLPCKRSNERSDTDCFLSVLMEFLNFVLQIVRHVEAYPEKSCTENDAPVTSLVSNAADLVSTITDTLLPFVESSSPETHENVKRVISELSTVSKFKL
ncbi:brefeldin A-inhibited guanine nucleotide-exchange protein 3 [Clonorchis sinensis]|uniref:Brefeldin A-inhibited guanine nucleotide-exchange protein 3 n=1 Tax=Clonorchis sinensis TaxID=79923 RepID=G7YAV4_CLOSI|nr:brefeldin A-inhibited guanine nucleotide-exchange protein 3 [Clonorchis sinensis]